MDNIQNYYNYIKNESERLDEALVTFGGKAYPKFGQIVLLGGGWGSGKGFIKSNLLGIDGLDFEIDKIKHFATLTPKIVERAKKELGVDLSAANKKLNKNALKDSDVATMQHDVVIKKFGADAERLKRIIYSAAEAHPNRKPNLIFDMSLKNMKQFNEYVPPFLELGYDKKNVHIVWVVNDIFMALKQNKERDRVGPDDGVIKSHAKAASTMKNLLTDAKKLSRYMDGDFVLVFNKKYVDNDYHEKKQSIPKNGKKAAYVSRANYIYVKRRGQKVDVNSMTNDVLTKISYYLPSDAQQEWIDLIK